MFDVISDFQNLGLGQNAHLVHQNSYIYLTLWFLHFRTSRLITVCCLNVLISTLFPFTDLAQFHFCPLLCNFHSFFPDFQLCRPEYHWKDLSSRNAHLVHQNWYRISFTF
jgi:hypothetical protein